MMKPSTDRWSIVHVVSVTTLASFLTGVNARLALVGLPTIAQSLNASITIVVWIIQGYMLGSTFMQVLIGRLADLYGRVRLFNIGILVFTLGALAAGLSTNSIEVVFSRILQGAGAAFLMALSITILTDYIPSTMLATWLGINQVAWRAGALIGLTLSGFIIDHMGWHWLFLVQVPIGVASYLWSRHTLREIYRPVEKPVIDWRGFTIFTSSVTLLLIALTLLTYGQEFVLLGEVSIAIAILLIAVFTVTELREENPLVDLRLFKIWQFTGGIITQMLYSIAFGASLTLLSIYLQLVRGLSATDTGLALLPFELSFLIAGVAGGRLSDLYGYVPITIAGLLVAGASLYMLSELSSLPESSIAMLFIAVTVLGIGTGLFTTPNTSSIMVSVPPYRRGIASSIRTLTFNIGFMISLNIAVLAMATHMPYELASKIFTYADTSTQQVQTGYIVNSVAQGISTAFRIQAITMLMAIPFSLSRIKHSHMAKNLKT